VQGSLSMTPDPAQREAVPREHGGPDRADPARKLPAPMGIAELLAVEEPEEDWLAVGLIPAGGNILVAGYPKTFKTMVLLDLAVSLASGTAFLGKFVVPRPRRVGIVLMEDQAHRVRHRLKRLCAGRGIELSELEGSLFLWFRPPLRLSDPTVVELAGYSRELELDFLGLDSWSYVASGDSNSADEVTPQLQALSCARVERPGLTVQLTHHARKDRGDADETRLTDQIRNSGAFGAWYDGALVLTRKAENSPVRVRAELRDFPPPDGFAFTVEDEDPAGPHNRFRSGGWLRLEVSDQRPELVEHMATIEQLVPAVRDLLLDSPAGVSRTRLREGVRGKNAHVEAAFDILVKRGAAEHIPSQGQGKPAIYRLLPDHPAPPCPNPAPGRAGQDPAHPAPTPVGGGQGQGFATLEDLDGPRGRVHRQEPDSWTI